MRVLLLLVLALSLTTAAVAQEDGATTNTTDGAAGNETAADGGEGNESSIDEGGDAPAEPAGPLEVILEGHQQGSSTYFLDPATGQRNPTITAQPGQQVTIVMRVVSGFHNLHVDGQPATPVVGPDEEVSVTFTMPESGTLAYWCDPHRGGGMQGRVSIASAGGNAGGGGGAADDISGETIDLGQYSPACAGQVAPAAATQGIVGLPTLEDYIQQCSSTGGEVVTQERAAHPADYVIPVSWLLIGLGVVGVVWVHKYYKP